MHTCNILLSFYHVYILAGLIVAWKISPVFTLIYNRYLSEWSAYALKKKKERKKIQVTPQKISHLG